MTDASETSGDTVQALLVMTVEDADAAIRWRAVLDAKPSLTARVVTHHDVASLVLFGQQTPLSRTDVRNEAARVWFPGGPRPPLLGRTRMLLVVGDDPDAAADAVLAKLRGAAVDRRTEDVADGVRLSRVPDGGVDSGVAGHEMDEPADVADERHTTDAEAARNAAADAGCLVLASRPAAAVRADALLLERHYTGPLLMAVTYTHKLRFQVAEAEKLLAQLSEPGYDRPMRMQSVRTLQEETGNFANTISTCGGFDPEALASLLHRQAEEMTTSAGYRGSLATAEQMRVGVDINRENLRRHLSMLGDASSLFNRAVDEADHASNQLTADLAYARPAVEEFDRTQRLTRTAVATALSVAEQREAVAQEKRLAKADLLNRIVALTGLCLAGGSLWSDAVCETQIGGSVDWRAAWRVFLRTFGPVTVVAVIGGVAISFWPRTFKKPTTDTESGQAE